MLFLLFFLYSGGHTEFVALLLQREANANVRGLEGNTPLHHAALEVYFLGFCVWVGVIFGFLLGGGLEGKTSLYTTSDPTMCVCVCVCVCVCDTRTCAHTHMQHMYMCACMCVCLYTHPPTHTHTHTHTHTQGHVKVASALMQANADVNLMNEHKLTPLHMAFMGGHHGT